MLRLLTIAAALITTHADETVTLKRDAPADEPQRESRAQERLFLRSATRRSRAVPAWYFFLPNEMTAAGGVLE